MQQRLARDSLKKTFSEFSSVFESAENNLWKIFSNFFSVFESAHEIIHYFSSLSSLSYSSFSVKLNCSRIWSWMNHLVSLCTLSELLMRFLMFIWSVHEAAIWCFVSAKQKQWAITCAAVSLAQLHWQAEDSISDTCTLFKNAARSILSVFIWVITVLSVLWKAVCCLTAACPDFLISSSSHSDLSVFHHCFHLVSSTLNTERLFWCSFFNHVSAHWILTSSSVCTDCCCFWCLLFHNLLQILRHTFLIRFFMSDFLYLSWNCVNLVFRYRLSEEVNVSVFSTEIKIA